MNTQSRPLHESIDELWETVRSAGRLTPLGILDHISTLVFLKYLKHRFLFEHPASSLPLVDELVTRFDENVALDLSPRSLRNLVDDAFNSLPSYEGLRNLFIDASAEPIHPQAFEMVDRLFDWNSPSRVPRLGAEIFQILLDRVDESGPNAQFATPVSIASALVHLLAPQVGRSVIDPACGTGTLLAEAFQYMRLDRAGLYDIRYEANGRWFSPDSSLYWKELQSDEGQPKVSIEGIDIDRTMARIALTHLCLSVPVATSIANAIRCSDSLVQNDDVSASTDYVISAPPAGLSVPLARTSNQHDRSSTIPIELAFARQALKALRNGGSAGLIVPENLLYGTSPLLRDFRASLIEENRVKAIISLPAGTVLPFSNAKTSLLIFERGGQSDEVWFYDVSCVGYSLTARRTPQPEKNDLWDMMLKYHLHFRSQQSDIPHLLRLIAKSPFLPLEDKGPEILERLYFQPHFNSETRLIISGGTSPLHTSRISTIDHFEIVDRAEIGGPASPKHWTARIQLIREQGYDLSASRYQPRLPVPTEHRPLADILLDVDKVEREIEDQLAALKQLLEPHL